MSARTIGWITVDRDDPDEPWCGDGMWETAEVAQRECAQYGVEYPDREWAVARVVIEDDE